MPEITKIFENQLEGFAHEKSFRKISVEAVREDSQILATTIIRRLQEIGLVKRRKEKLEVFYSVK